MTAEAYFVGVDVGTEGSRAAVYRADGSQLSTASEAHQLEHIRSGWVEQQPEKWWASATTAVRQAVAAAQIESGQVAGISMSGTGTTVVAARADGTPLRSSLMWMDVRARDEARRIAESRADVLALSAGSASAEWFFSKTLWIADNEPDIYRDAEILCECVDWLGHRLTGVWAANLSLAAVRAYYRISEGGWPVDLLRRIGHADVLAKVPGQVLAPGSLLGELTAAAAADLGLRVGTPVAVSAADAEVGVIGLGAVHVGQTTLITGSSNLLLGVTANRVQGPGMFGAYEAGLLPGSRLVEGGQASTGSITRWLKNLVNGSFFGAPLVTDEDAYARLIEAASAVPIGSGGVRVFDSWQGNRTPYVDADARGIVWGLTVGHGPEHLFRGVLEGIAFGTENILRSLRANGYTPSELIMTGGATRNPLWLRIHADVSQVPLVVSRAGDAVSLGNAMLAASAAGRFASVEQAISAMAQESYRIEPDPSAAQSYREIFESYEQSYHAMRGLMHSEAERARGAVAPAKAAPGAAT